MTWRNIPLSLHYYPLTSSFNPASLSHPFKPFQDLTNACFKPNNGMLPPLTRELKPITKTGEDYHKIVMLLWFELEEICFDF